MFLGVGILLACCACGAAQETSDERPRTVLRLQEFVELAVAADTEFESILVEELRLQYRQDLVLPARDLVLSVRQELNAFLDADRQRSTTAIGLSKLFPMTGTDVGAEYRVTPSSGADGDTGELAFSLGQPIARNAFGRSTRLLDRIVGIETNVASHQIEEAYEDYLAAISTAYYDWHEAHENLRVARSSYNENVKLLGNIRDRQERQIAKVIDVNKITLQVLAKKERLIEAEESYQARLASVERAIRHDGKTELVPELDGGMSAIDGPFATLFGEFLEESRTFRILALLEERSTLVVDLDADDLLPSLDVVAGVSIRGEKHRLEDSDRMIFLGLELEWPFPGQLAAARHEDAGIDREVSELRRTNVRYRLFADLKVLHHELRKERRLIEVAVEKIALAEAVVKDETENYSFGRVTLNDYITAVNVLDSNRFNRILHEARYRKLLTEWRRLTDVLVTARQVRERRPAR